MALKGTLDDLNIVELVQFPFAGRKTGQLIIEFDGRSGSMFYQEGKLVHAVLGDRDGFEAIVDIVGWEKGGFEFIPDVQPQQVTIKMDLHRVVMQALKTRDERRFAKQRKSQQVVETVAPVSTKQEVTKPAPKDYRNTSQIEDDPFASEELTPSYSKPESDIESTIVGVPDSNPDDENSHGSLDPQLRNELKMIADANRYIVYLCVLSKSERALSKDNDSGSMQLVADYKKYSEDDAIFDQLRASLSALVATHASSRGELKRVMIEDEKGIVMLMGLNETATLIVVTSIGTSLGAVSVSVNKMGTALSDLVSKW